MSDGTPAVDALTALRDLVNILDVNVPSDGLLQGKTVLWFVAGPEHRFCLEVATNSYNEAALNTIDGALQQARKALGQ